MTLEKPLIRWMVLLGALALGTVAVTKELAVAETSPNPYQEVKNWAKLPEGRMWGHVFGVAVDSHDNVWAVDRCGGDTCADSDLAPILEFDSSGKFLKSFGEGLFAFPHSLYVDKDDNVWATDCGVKDGKGNQIFKFSPEGKILMMLGTLNYRQSARQSRSCRSGSRIRPHRAQGWKKIEESEGTIMSVLESSRTRSVSQVAGQGDSERRVLMTIDVRGVDERGFRCHRNLLLHGHYVEL